MVEQKIKEYQETLAKGKENLIRLESKLEQLEVEKASLLKELADLGLSEESLDDVLVSTEKEVKLIAEKLEAAAENLRALL